MAACSSSRFFLMASAKELPFISRRSPVLSINGIAASSQPFASQVGLQILQDGGNAADAAVAMAATLNVTEPCSTGIGGDAFCLYYDAQTKKVMGLNGSGRAPSNLTIDHLHQEGIVHPTSIPKDSGHAVTVPGAAACWIDTVDMFGSKKELALSGKDGFYKGRIAKAIVDVVNKHGGVMTLDDLSLHKSTQEVPISTNYRGINVFEIPPNGQGITALMALNILEAFDVASLGHNSVEYLHILAEALSLSFADALWYVADPSQTCVPTKQMISKEYASKRRQIIQKDRCLESYIRGEPLTTSDTVYFTVVDCHGNACSFINSNYMMFGTGLVPEGCGFTLQNRGTNFSLDPNHPNALAPNKRPYHTIIPSMATYADTGELYASFGVMGGFMQPQGHVQVLANMIDFKMNPQQALDAPRLCINLNNKTKTVFLEDGISEGTINGLKNLGHNVQGPVQGFSRSLFGRGQIIAKRKGNVNHGEKRTVYWAGSDPRGDGMAVTY